VRGGDLFDFNFFWLNIKKANSTSIELAFYKNELLNKAILL
jgi:hypothetical protein